MCKLFCFAKLNTLRTLSHSYRIPFQKHPNRHTLGERNYKNKHESNGKNTNKQMKLIKLTNTHAKQTLQEQGQIIFCTYVVVVVGRSVQMVMGVQSRRNRTCA